MTDRELLGLAARAAGIKTAGWFHEHDVFQLLDDGEDGSGCWNALTDDGDALRLAVRLGLIVSIHHGESWAQSYETPGGWLTCKESHDGEPLPATRRAIVRAAAEIGKQKG